MKKFYISIIFILLGAFCLIFFYPLKKDLKSNLGKPTETERDEEVLARIKQEVLMTKDPQLGYVPVERLEAAKKQWSKLVPGNSKSPAPPLGGGSGTGANILGEGLLWAERGPNNIGGR